MTAHKDGAYHWAGKQFLSDLSGATQYQARVSAENAEVSDHNDDSDSDDGDDDNSDDYNCRVGVSLVTPGVSPPWAQCLAPPQ